MKRQSSCDRNPLQKLKEGCESKKHNYKYEVEEVPVDERQQFQFKVTVRDGAGRVLCEEVGSIKGNKKDAQHDAASKANAKLRF